MNLTPTQTLVGSIAALSLGAYFFLKGVRHEPEGRRFGHHAGYAAKMEKYYAARAKHTQTRRSR